MLGDARGAGCQPHWATADGLFLRPRPPSFRGALPVQSSEELATNSPKSKKGLLRSYAANPLPLVPERGIEPPTFSLRMSCSTD